MYEFGTRPGTDKELHVSIHSGGHMVSPERYMETVAALKPDLYVTLCDEVTADAKPKRVATSLKRNAAWLDACLRLHAHYRETGRPPPPPPPPSAVEGSGPAQGLEQKAQGRDRQQRGGAQEREHSAVEPEAPPLAVAGQQPQLELQAQPQQEQETERRGAGCSVSARPGGGPLDGAITLAALAGGSIPAERARAAAAVADKDGVGGYALCGLGTGEAPEQRADLIAASLGALPAEALERRPVFAAGLVASPQELLDAVAAGVDLLDCAVVAQVTAGGYALTFPLRPPPDWQPRRDEPSNAPDAPAAAPAASGSVPAGPGLGPDVSIGADDTKINLWSTSYRLDKGSLLPGCSCFACRRHSRAYVHHLLNTHEMLGDVLLEAHNTSHLMAFCQAIRESIADGRFEAYRSWFRSLRAAPLMPAPRRVATKRAASDVAAVDRAGEEGAVTATEGDEGKAKWVRV